ncbi:LysR family transcriptional regulator [Lentibacter algarum]|uniref:LysR family transcriptional regulator n=1 Tax=Lentibacter algarum TaxID=576131 RepID=UPI001C0770C6|nr:LysR family transcriptional regulator [Lentibacter algarum]MBU2981612.1 LysR family transcriptional regulator [Lentibacter algarum]
MQNWDEIRTAYFVAKKGTVSGAAEVLGLHHATVIRHVDALEEQLKTKLFQRHARGYTPTEAGQELLKAAQSADDEFSQLEGKIKGRSDVVEGELVITSLAQLTGTLMPIIKDFQDIHPNVTVRYLAGEKLLRLEFGEAHVAIRAGEKAPDQDNNVVQHLADMKISLFAAPSYIKQHGRPEGMSDLSQHRFIGSAQENARAPYFRWMAEHVEETQIVLRADDSRAAESAVRAGIGLGFLPEGSGQADLVRVAGPERDWAAKLWLVTHVDLHRTAKVQAFTQFLKAQMAG